MTGTLDPTDRIREAYDALIATDHEIEPDADFLLWRVDDGD